MAANFKIGDLVWAKMKGFPPWPGKVTTPPENKRVSDKKPRVYIFFFGSENYAWVTCDNVWSYLENREKYMTLSRPSGSFQEALDAIDQELREGGGTLPEKSEKSRSPSPVSAKKDEEHANNVKSTPATKRSRKRQSQAKGKTKEGDEADEELAKPAKLNKSMEGDMEVRGRRLSRKKVKAEEEEEEEEMVDEKRSDGEEKVEEIRKEDAGEEEMGGDDDNEDKEASKEDIVEVFVEEMREEESKEEEMREEKKFEQVEEPEDAPPAVVVAKVMRRSLPVPAKQPENQKSTTKKAYLPDILPPTTTTTTSDIAKLKSGITPSPKRIGFLGIGDMGEALVGCLIATGHQVTIWNRTISKCKELLKKGATKCSTPSDVVNQCDIVFACVSDAAALKDVVFGGKGVLQAITDGKGFVNLSTVDTETTMDVAEAITTRGGRFLEAPLIGSREMSKTGQMLVLTSGEQMLYEECTPCLKSIGKNVFNLVDLGMASKMQIVLNALYGTTLAGLAESLSLASKVGLDPCEVLEVLGHSSASSSLIREKGHDMVKNKIIDASCRLTTLQRDLRLAINMSEIVDQPLHVGSAVNELFKKAKAKGYGDMDISAIYRAADL